MLWWPCTEVCFFACLATTPLLLSSFLLSSSFDESWMPDDYCICYCTICTNYYWFIRICWWNASCGLNYAVFVAVLLIPFTGLVFCGTEINPIFSDCYDGWCEWCEEAWTDCYYCCCYYYYNCWCWKYFALEGPWKKLGYNNCMPTCLVVCGADACEEIDIELLLLWEEF